MKQKSTREIKQQLQKLAGAFDLKCNVKWFDFMFISKKHNILMEYIGQCPDLIYNKFGKNSEARVRNIQAFINSGEFKKCLRRFRGQVITKKGLEQIWKLSNKIENSGLRKELQILYKKINLKNKDYIVLLTKTADKKQHNLLMTRILRHEWIHVLLEKNKIYFQKKNKKDWKYDEGFVTYCEAFLDNNLYLLEAISKRIKYPMEKQYYVCAIKFKRILHDKNSPVERKKIILNILK